MPLIGVVSREDQTATVGTRLRRIFLERGIDFFEAEKGTRAIPRDSKDAAEEDGAEQDEGKAGDLSHQMTPEELYKMRVELMNAL